MSGADGTRSHVDLTSGRCPWDSRTPEDDDAPEAGTYLSLVSLPNQYPTD